MFEQTFKNIDDVLHKDAGCGSELDYVEQTSWVLFLKYLDDLEKDKATDAELTGKKYTKIISPEYQWSVWAVPKGKDGKLDHHTALSGDDLVDFVNNKLFPYLKKFKTSAESADTIEYKIGEIFSELKNRIQSGYNLREVINRIDELRFRTHAEKHEMSHLYEDKIKNMGNAGRNGGEYYTPRPLIKTIVQVVGPKIGDRIYDGAVGSAGFLVEAFDYLKNSKKLTVNDLITLQKKTFYGKEKKSLAYIIGTMNMILHGVEAPNIVHTNTLAENISDIQEKDRYDIVLANPPFGGNEREEVQQNFPIKSSETAYLFLQHFIKSLKAGGKAGIVIKNTFLSNGGANSSDASLRKSLLDNCNLHTVLLLPKGAFTGAGVQTVVLFFEKGKPTQKVWFYELNLDRNLGKTNPLNEKDLADFVKLQKTKAESENSWSVVVKDIDQKTFDLSSKNPQKKEEEVLRQAKHILDEIKLLDKKCLDLLTFNFKESNKQDWETRKLGDICEVLDNKRKPITKKDRIEGEYPYYGATGILSYVHNFIFNEKLVLIGEDGAKWLSGDTTAFIVEGKYWVNNHAHVIRPKREIVLDEWLVYFLNFSDLTPYITGMTVPKLNQEKMRSIEIPIPPLNEQKRIIDILNKTFTSVEIVREITQKKINNLSQFKKSVLQKTFNGELDLI